MTSSVVEHFLIQIDQGDILILVSEHLGQVKPYVTRTGNYDFHAAKVQVK